MAVRENLPIPADPDFSAEIGGLNQDDPVHYAQMNAILTRLLTNDVFLEKLASKMVEKTLIAHVLDSTNTSMVLGADQAPALTALLDTERERITKLNSDITVLNTKILELKSYTNEIKYRSYQTVIPIQESWIDGNICNIPFDITTALMTDKPYIFYVLPCSVIGHQVRYDYDLSTSTVAIVSIEFGAQLIAGNNVRFGIFIAGI